MLGKAACLLLFNYFFITIRSVLSTLTYSFLFETDLNYDKSSIKYPCERSKVLSPKRKDELETNQKIKCQQKEQKLGIHELLYKTSVGSGAHEGKASCVLRAAPVVEFLISKSVSNQDVKIGSVNFCQIRKESHELLYKQGVRPGIMKCSFACTIL